MIELDGTPEQGPARRQRDPRRLPGRRQGGRGGRRAAPLPLPGRALRRRRAERPAGADDERPERRRPRRQLGRLPGVHGRPRGSGQLLRVPAARGRGLPRAEEEPRRPGALDGGRRRGRIRPRPGFQRGRPAGGARRASRRPATSPATTSSSPSTRRPARSIEGGAYVLEHEGRTPLLGGDGRLLGGRLRPLPDRLARGRHGRGGLGRLEAAHRAAGGAGAAGRRRPLRHQPGAPAPGHRARRRQLDPRQGQPDRHPDARRWRRSGSRREAGYTAVISHRSGRDRGHDDRRPGRGHRRRPDQDRRALALGPRRQVQPAAADRGGARHGGRVSRA